MCRKLGLQTNGTGFLPSLGHQFSDLGTAGLVRKQFSQRETLVCLGSSVEKPRVWHSLPSQGEICVNVTAHRHTPRVPRNAQRVVVQQQNMLMLVMFRLPSKWRVQS